MIFQIAGGIILAVFILFGIAIAIGVFLKLSEEKARNEAWDAERQRRLAQEKEFEEQRAKKPKRKRGYQFTDINSEDT